MYHLAHNKNFFTLLILYHVDFNSNWTKICLNHHSFTRIKRFNSQVGKIRKIVLQKPGKFVLIKKIKLRCPMQQTQTRKTKMVLSA